MRKLILIFLALLFASSFTLAQDALYCISGNEYYDASTESFMFLVDGDFNGIKVYSTAADRMITTDTVTISSPQIDNVFIYREGRDVTSEGYENISTPGDYVVNIKQNNGNVEQVLSFTILNQISGKIDTFTVPDGFAISSVKKEGEDLPFKDSSVELQEEGNYKITSLCFVTGKEYTAEVTIDHTPPTLSLSNVENGVARGPVDISDLPEDIASVYITLDGTRINYQEVLNTSGSYYVYLLDKAGNLTEYSFKIGVYFNFSSLLFIGITLGGAIALLIYLLRSRNKLQIR